ALETLMPNDAALASLLVMASTVPALLPVAELVRFSKVPVVIDDVTNENAVCVESVPQAQVCAFNVLSIVFTAVADVSEERLALPAAPQPVQVPVTIRLPATVVVPLR